MEIFWTFLLGLGCFLAGFCYDKRVARTFVRECFNENLSALEVVIKKAVVDCLKEELENSKLLTDIEKQQMLSWLVGND